MLNQKIHTLINDQINKEFYSAYLYLDISNYYYDEGLEGFGNWYKIQAQEERDHANLMMQYLQNNGAKVTLEAIAKPETNFNNFGDGLKLSYHHEKYITDSIHKIYDAAYEIKDYRTMEFLNWFVKEQGEEEKNAEDLVQKYEMFGSEIKALYMMDSELKERSYDGPELTL